MEQSTAVSRMSPAAAGRAPAFRWALSARRRPGSDKEATVLACAVLDALGVPGEGSASLVSDLARATAYVLTHGSADAYRLTIEIDGGQCAVRVDDREAGEEPGGEGAAQQLGTGEAGAGRLCVHHRTDGSLVVFFRRPFPEVTELASGGPEEPDGPERPSGPERAGGPERTGSADVVPLPVAPLASGACGRSGAVATDLAAEG
ncbi:hypothetical protein [Streptomyces purpurogeneiscleroticus]|uniref:hypothetical protein n=1 Tax=Streptomyces purpurogeneiscleroticus TaxID=68259 RepID=UPI001CBF4D23|nr:hypothetical protein [Streptomyces purpurogeneiscleroticus]MBZ4016391.1 hypothetical protein [Streptomyces purpurogeneiscleroticus]